MARQDVVFEKIKDINPHSTREHNPMALTILFAEVYKDYCRYNRQANKWFIYNGKIWEADTKSCNLHLFIKEFVVLMKQYAFSIGDRDYLSLVGRLSSYYHRENMSKDCRPHYYFDSKQADRNPMLLNCQNGTLDLWSFQLEPHKPDDLLTKICNVEYNPDEKSDKWQEFIEQIMCGDRDKITYLQKILGYALTGITSYETCWVLYGASTRNGKSTLVETIAYMLGKDDGYAMEMNPETLAMRKKDNRQASGDIARLEGCRFLNASEPPKSMWFDIGLLKTLLGRDTITARRLYESEIQFVPCFKLFINTNYLPQINDDTIFSSGRLNVITFDRHFTTKEQNKTLKDKLQQPHVLSEVLNWCLDGLRQLRIDGHLNPPQCVIDATAEYRKISDKIGNFVEDCLFPATINSRASMIYPIYKEWCENNGYGVESKTSFYSDLRQKGLLLKTGTVEGKTYNNVFKGYVKADVFSGSDNV